MKESCKAKKQMRYSYLPTDRVFVSKGVVQEEFIEIVNNS